MSLLHQEYEQELDDAGRGEELTKGTSQLVIAVLIAVMVVSSIIAIYAIVGQKPPYATGQVTAIWVHPKSTVTSGFDASGAPIPQHGVDQVMVFTTVRLKNQTDHPIFLSNVTTNATLDDGIHSSYAATKSDYDRTFVAYPDLPVPHLAGISPINTTIAPGQTLEGNFVSSFMMTQKQWDARKNFDYTFYFQYQAPLTITPHVPITEQ
ncbi:MAG: hypothetical protein WBP85_04430 [Terracidiphilus sp.]